MSLETIVEMAELLDCYGALLTERQQNCLDLYYNDNLTLAEIADRFHISRQAVHDAMARGEEQLASYEAALHLARMRREKEGAAAKLMTLIPGSREEEARPLLQILTE